ELGCYCAASAPKADICTKIGASRLPVGVGGPGQTSCPPGYQRVFSNWSPNSFVYCVLCSVDNFCVVGGAACIARLPPRGPMPLTVPQEMDATFCGCAVPPPPVAGGLALLSLDLQPPEV